MDLSLLLSTGADQVAMIELELSKLGFVCWLDNRADDLTKAGMRAGIESSGCFVLFLSRGCLGRPYVQYELTCALELEKRVVLVHECDDRHSPFHFSADRELAPPHLRCVLDDIESIAFRRRGYERDAMLHRIVKQAGYEVMKRRKRLQAELPPEVPALPSTFVSRAAQGQLKALLLKQEPPVLKAFGMGGAGKTCVATVLVRDVEVGSGAQDADLRQAAQRYVDAASVVRARGELQATVPILIKARDLRTELRVADPTLENAGEELAVLCQLIRCWDIDIMPQFMQAAFALLALPWVDETKLGKTLQAEITANIKGGALIGAWLMSDDAGIGRGVAELLAYMRTKDRDDWSKYDLNMTAHVFTCINMLTHTMSHWDKAAPQLFSDGGATKALSEAYRILASIHAMQGKRVEAEAGLHRAIECARQCSSELLEAQAAADIHDLLGTPASQQQLAEATGRLEGTQQQLEQAVGGRVCPRHARAE
eukprot:g1654.t1